MSFYKKHSVLLLILVQQLVTKTKPTPDIGTSCPRPEVGTCVCTWTGPYSRVTCNGLDVMPENIPINTTYLKITDGTIKEIPENILLPLKHLASLQAQNNSISKRFRLPKSTWSLDLSFNMLNASSLYGMFDGLTKLKFLDLSYNPINGSFIPGTFKSLRTLKRLRFQHCHLKHIEEGTFTGLIELIELNIKANDLEVIKRGAFKGIKSRKDEYLYINLVSNKIAHIEDGTFKEVQVIGRLNLKGNKLTVLPDLRGLKENNLFLVVQDNNIADISSLTRAGIKSITYLSFDANNISVLPESFFRNINILQLLILSRNKIKEIPAGFLENSPSMNVLLLQNNQIEKIDKNSFIGMKNLQGLYLFNNRIKHLPDGVFANLTLSKLFLNGNRLKNLTGRPFKGMKKTNLAIYLFGNDIEHIGEEFLDDLGNQSTLSVGCKSLKNLPHIQRSSLARITCAPYNLGWITNLQNVVAYSLSSSGFFCNKIASNNWKCIPCKAGYFQTSREFDESALCTECSAGGFYQDEMAQIQCKKCNIGTYVHPTNTPGTTPLSCQACPQGTNSSEHAGYRGCKCLTDFYRFDRFGRCFSCPSNAFKCENDYASLSTGFYWKWQNNNHEQQYRKFIANLMIDNRDFTVGTWKYVGNLPTPHKCPRTSCLGGLNSSCETGYQGPLCALCAPDYYNRMSRCVSCPSRSWAGFQIAIVVALFVVILLALMWGDRKKLKNERGRTMADKILSCFKICVGFYQVMAGVYSAFSDISWPSSVLWMQKILHFIQLNMLQIAPLSCISARLSFNILQQFNIVVASNIIIVGLIALYLMIRIALLKRKSHCNESDRDAANQNDEPNVAIQNDEPNVEIQNDEPNVEIQNDEPNVAIQNDEPNVEIQNDEPNVSKQMAETKSSCIRNICVFLFATYPKTCTSIIQVLSINCVQLCFDKDHAHCDSYLRSDLSVQCHTPEHNIYSYIALAFLVYPIGFPVVIAFLVWKYIHKPSSVQRNNQEVDLSQICDGSQVNIDASPKESPFQRGLSLFSENYNSECWYWEVFEMIRKLVLISGLTLIGKHSRTQVGIGAIISAVFAILYVYKRPIKNPFENLLQTVALMAIFLNLAIGVMLKASDNQMSPVVNKQNDDVGVSIVLIIINVAVIGIVTVAVLKVIYDKMKSCCTHIHSCAQVCSACGTCCQDVLEYIHLDQHGD